MVSDTEDGENTGKFLKEYYLHRKDLNLKDDDVKYIIIKDLQDRVPKKFKINGLRNLVREIGNIVKNYDKKNIAIDATGGYKAQIALAVIIGQALDIPVYYKHEFFGEIIDFAPLPISLDYELYGKYASLFNELENYDIIEADSVEFNTIEDEKIKLFLEEEEIDGKKYISLNAIGELYCFTFNLRHPRAVYLQNCREDQREEPEFPDDHFPIGFQNFIKKVYQENSWIKNCITIPYDKQRSIRGIEFYVDHINNERRLIGTYKDKNGFGARFRIFLCNESNENLNLAAKILNENYGLKNR